MNSLCAIFALLSLSLFAATTGSRIGAGGGFMKHAIDKKSIQGDLWKLVKAEEFELKSADLSKNNAEKHDCDENEKAKMEFEIVEFELRPESKALGDMQSKDNDPKDKLSFEVKAKTKAFEEEFEPRPSATMYND